MPILMLRQIWYMMFANVSKKSELVTYTFWNKTASQSGSSIVLVKDE
jgi:hypothetical protein